MGVRVVVAMLAGLAALPTGAAAGPVEDAARQVTATPPAGTASGQIASAVRESRARVEPVVRAVTDVEPVRSVVDAVAGSEPVRATVRAIARPVERVAPGTTAAVAAVVERQAISGPATSPRHQAIGRPQVGGIDRGADSRSGNDLGLLAQLRDTVAPSSDFGDTLNAIAAERARADSSSTASSGNDGFDFGHPFGHGGGADIGGPLGVALVALLGLLAGTLLLAPRFLTRLLRMSPARWGPVAFLSPIERPG